MSDAAPWLVAGLGNPGKEFAGNRHNVGFMVADLLATRMGAKFGRAKRVQGRGGRGPARVRRPQAGAGEAADLHEPVRAPVVALAQFFKVPVSNVIAVHDELDVPFGQVRAKLGGGEGGHNGLRSMSKSLASKEYARVRFGIGRPPGRMDAADYVLADFAAAERKELDFLVDRAADVVEAIVLEGVEWAQNKYHGE